MTAEVIVDTSLALKWTFLEEHTGEARGLLTQWGIAGVRRTVPSWFACEVANACFQRVRTGQLDFPDARSSLQHLLSLVTVQDFDPAIAVRAIELAWRLGQRASYDAQYLALAEHLDCELWTADVRFWNAAKPAFPRIRWVGEVSGGAVN